MDQVTSLAQSTTTFDEKIGGFVRTLRGDFRSAREELAGLLEERVELVLEDARAMCRELGERQDTHNRKINEEMSELNR
jgi:hypothetical protein